LLSAGGSKHFSQLLKPFELDITQEDFWQKSNQTLIDMIDDLEKLM